MSNLRVGFSRANINPPMGIPISGYFIPRFAEAILDDLELNVLALEYGEVRTLLISVDHCGIEQVLSRELRQGASEVTGIPVENIILSATHTHTAPVVEKNSEDELVKEYTTF